MPSIQTRTRPRRSPRSAITVGLYSDFYDSPRAARRANRRAAQLQLAPLGPRAAGLVLGGTF
jgi:hypothetical protein